VADFVARGSRVAIYVDGAAFHRGDRLRRDRVVRARLRAAEPPWAVVECRASDLRDGSVLVDRLRDPNAKRANEPG
jgi:hypothetical protein